MSRFHRHIGREQEQTAERLRELDASTQARLAMNAEFPVITAELVDPALSFYQRRYEELYGKRPVDGGGA